jgi:hypothetical protein
MGKTFEQFREEFNGAALELHELAEEMIKVDDADCQIIGQRFLDARRDMFAFLENGYMELG